MKKNYVDSNYMTSIIKNASLEDQRLYMNLYKTYDLLARNYNLKPQIIDSLDLIDEKTKAELRKIEDRIYTINNETLTSKERIALELKNIVGFINRNGDRIPKEIKQKVLNELEELKAVSKRNDIANKDMIMYFKKRITILQAYLGMNIKFFSAAIEVFDEQILMSRIKVPKGSNKR